MFKCLVALSLIAVCCSETATKSETVPIVAMENIQNDGNFHYSYESGDGTKVHEEGVITPGDKPEEGVESVKGGFDFVSPEGKNIVIEYTADENGYHPSGDVLPVAPPIPPLIAQSLRALKNKPPGEESDY